MKILVYVIGFVFLALILRQAFKMITGLGENVCGVCGKEAKKILWVEDRGKITPVCYYCLAKKGGEE